MILPIAAHHFKNMKKITPILASVSLIFFGGLLIAHAQTNISGDYTALAPLPLGPGGTILKTYTLSTYIAGAIKLLIALGAGFSVLVAIIGGVQYVAAGALPSAKTGAKERIVDAFVGLALVLTSYLILNSINPDLVNFKLELPLVGQQPVNMVSSTSTASTTSGAPWPDDSTERALLENGDSSSNVDINHLNCSNVGQSGCTSVYQLPTNAINALRSLSGACGASCYVMITGGTEQWLHQTHGPRKPVVDLQHATGLDNYIYGHSSAPTIGGSCGVSSANHYAVSGPGAGIYVAEGTPPATDGSSPHWHVCLY